MNEARLENELRKRNLQESKQIEILNRSESILKKSKSQALKSQSSLLKLSKFKKEYSTNIELNKHKKIWIEEKERLDSIGRILDLQCHQIALQIIDEIKPGDECYALAADLSMDLQNNTYYEQAKEIRGNATSLVSVKKSIIKEEQEEDLLDKIDDELIKLKTALGNLDKRYEKVTRQLLIIPQHHFNPSDFLTEWIEFDGTLLRFQDLKYTQEHIQENHENVCDDMIYSYKIQLENLKSKHNTEKYQGWSEQDHFLFIKLREEYATQLKDKFTLFCSRVKKELPHLSTKQISEHYDWCNQYQAYQEKRASLTRHYQSQTRELVAKTIHGIIQEREFLEKEKEREQYIQSRIEDTEVRHFRLMQFRKQKLEEMKADAAQRKLELEAEMKKDADRALKEKQRQRETKAQLELYHHQLKQKQLEEQKLQESIRVKEAEQQAETAKVFLSNQYNQERTQYRANMQKKKQKDYESKLLSIESEKQKLQERLDTLRKSVQVIAQRDWTRTTQDTISMSEHRKPDPKMEWFPMVGYSSDTIIKDKRMQIAIALYRNGLSNSKYGSQVLQSLAPQPKRVDTISQLKFE